MNTASSSLSSSSSSSSSSSMYYRPRMWSNRSPFLTLQCLLMCSAFLSCVPAVSVKGGFHITREIIDKTPPRPASLILSYLPSIMNSSSSVFAHQRVKRTAAKSGLPFTKDDKDLIVSAHNRVRADVGGASNMVEMEWNTDLETEAKRWASLCDFQHPPSGRMVGDFNGIGQNLFLAGYVPTAESAPALWESEGPDYDHGTFDCSSVCGHYTQVIWAETTSVGCAIEYCNPIANAFPLTTGYFIVCEYGPSGNIRGHDPYQKGSPCSQCPDGYTHCNDGLCSSKSSARSLRRHNTHLYFDLFYKVFISWIITCVVHKW